MPLEPFRASASLTLGVELELQLVNPADFDLSASASDMLHLLGRSRFPGDVKPEITESMIEVATDVQRNHGELLAQLRDIRDSLVAAGKSKADSRRNKLHQADIQLEQLRVWLRFSRDQNLITLRQYEHAIRQLKEVGNLLGAWLKLV